MTEPWLLLLAAVLSGEPMRIEGRWVLDAAGQAVPPREFERGLQTSGLLFHAGDLWSIGDQRGEWPGQLLRIDPASARLKGEPVKLRLPDPLPENPLFADYRSIRNSDFEGLAADPKDPNVLYGVTEDKRQWLVKIRLGGKADAPEAVVEAIAELEFPEGIEPYGGDLNYRIEGLALSDDGEDVFLAWERAEDKLPRIFAIKTKDATARKAAAHDLKIDFAALAPRADKEKALLNVNDLHFLRAGGQTWLLAVARDQERLLVISLAEKKVSRSVDLDLRAPGGESIFWVSPEGLAVDTAADRLWIVNDPDSIRGNYRRAGEEKSSGNFAAMAPLLFELKLSAVMAGVPAR